MANKRAVAFCRGVALASSAQGVLAVMKFGGGDLVGGFFDGIMAGLGLWSTREDGVQMLPSYILFSGFNGVIYLLQVVQDGSGLGAIVRPVVCLTGAYLGWQFLKELQSLSSGYSTSGPSDGDQDSWFVKFMNGDNVIADAAGAITHTQSTSSQAQNPSGSVAANFTTFSGEGHRLGGVDTTSS